MTKFSAEDEQVIEAQLLERYQESLADCFEGETDMCLSASWRRGSPAKQ